MVPIMVHLQEQHIQDQEKEIEKSYALFNPKIKSFSKETVVMEEGCLSLPKQFADIERPISINLKYIDENNQIIEEAVLFNYELLRKPMVKNNVNFSMH